MEIPQAIWITDTTFRDGQQSRPPFTPEQILRIYDLLHQIDGGTGLIRQCEFFLYSDKRPEGRGAVPGPRLPVPRDHRLDSGGAVRLQAGRQIGPAGDRDPDLAPATITSS